MPDFVKEGVAGEAELDELYARALEKTGDLEMRNMLRGPEDKTGAIMVTNSWARGTESFDWAALHPSMCTRSREHTAHKSLAPDLTECHTTGL